MVFLQKSGKRRGEKLLKRGYPASNLLLHLLYNLGKMQTSNLRQEVRKKMFSCYCKLRAVFGAVW